MATLSGNKIKDTYQSLVKFSDNGNITTSAKQLTDGFGNNSPLYLSTTQIGIGVTPEATYDLHVYSNAKVGGNLTITGDLTVNGTTTTIDTQTLTVEDPLIEVASDNTSTDVVDIGWYGKYAPSGTTLYAGMFRDTGDGKFKIFKSLEEQPTTTVNTGGTGYTVATLVANLEGNVTGGTISGTTGTFSGNVDIDGTLDVDDVISVEGSGFGRIEVGGASGGYIDLKAPNSDDYDLRLSSSVGGGELLSIDTLKFYTGSGTDLAFTIDASQNATFENNVTIPETPTADTHAASKGYVDAAVEGQDTLAEILANGNTSGGTDIAITAGDKITNFTSTGIDDNATSTVITIDSSGNIGINDDTPTYPLNIVGNTFLTGNLQITSFLIVDGNLTIDSDTSKLYLGDDQDLQIYHDGSNSYINDSGTGDLIFTSGVNERMRIQSGGDISINESNPLNSAKFYVNGIGYSTNAWSVGNSSGTIRGRLTTSGSILQIQSEENNDIQIGDTTSANIIHIDTSEDSVGIGLTNPADYTADELVISVPDGSGMTLVSGTTDAAYIAFQSSTGAIATNGGFIGYDHDADGLTMFAQSKVSVAIQEAEVAYFTDTAFYVDKSTTIDDNLIVNGNVGIGETSPDKLLHLKSSGATGIAIESTTNSQSLDIDFYNNVGSAQGRIRYEEGAGAFNISPNVSSPNAMYINYSNNVGIGTTDPEQKLHVEGASITVNRGNDDSSIAFQNSTSGATWRIGRDYSNSEALTFAYSATDYPSLTGNGLIYINTSGNVGIGVTPSTIWSSSYDALQIGLGGSIYAHSSAGNALKLGSNIVYEGTAPNYYDKYLSSSTATKYEQDSGSHIWSTASSGTAGNAVSWTESMRIDSSGTTSIIKTSAGSSTTPLVVRNSGSTSVGTEAKIFLSTVANDDRGAYISSIITDASNGNALILATNTAGSVPTERMRIDSSGNAIFTKSGGAYLQLKDASAVRGAINVETSDGLVFTTGSSFTERMRIDSSGNVGIGTTTPDEKLVVNGSIGLSYDGTNSYQGIKRTSVGNEYYCGTTSTGTNEIHTFTGSSSAKKLVILESGNVGIGTDSPSSRLTVSGVSPNLNDDENAIRIENHSSSAASPDELGNGIVFAQKWWSGSAQLARTGGIYGIKDASNGNYGGGLAFYTQPSGVTTDMVQRMRITSGGQLFLFNQTSGAGNATLKYTTGTGAVTYDTSSRLVKEDIVDIPYGLNTVLSLSPKKYRRIDSDDKIEIGFIADEVQEVVPELVGMMEKKLFTKNEEDTEIIAGSVEYEKMTSILVKAIQEQQEIINDLKNRIQTLENK